MRQRRCFDTLRSLRCVASVLVFAVAALSASPSVAAPPVVPSGETEAFELNRQAELAGKDGNLVTAISLAEQALAAHEKIAPDGRGVLMSLKQLAGSHASAGDHKKSAAMRARIVLIHEKAGKQGAELFYALEDLGNALHKAGEHARSVAAFERLTALAERQEGPESHHVTTALRLMVKPLSALQRYDDAEKALLRVVGILERQKGRRDSLPLPLLELGKLYGTMGQWIKAEATLQRALKSYEEAFPTMPWNLHKPLYALAAARSRLADYDGAQKALERARDIASKEGGEDDPLFALALLGLGALHLETGAYDRAESLITRSQAIFEKRSKPGDAERTATKLLLGQLAALKGDFERAEPALREALLAQEKDRGPLDQGLAEPLGYLSDLHRKKHEFKQAEVYAARAAAIIDQALPPTNPERAEVRARLGRVRELLGDVDGGKRLHEEALAMREKAFGPEHPHVARSLLDLADLARRRGRAEEAEGLYKRAVVIVEKSLGPDHDSVAASLEGLAAVYMGAAKIELAVRVAERAAAIRERQAALVIAGGSEAQKRSLVGTLATGTDFVVSLHARHAAGDAAARRLSLNTILQRKGRVLDVMAGTLASLKKRLSGEDQSLFDDLAAARAELARAAMRGPAGAPLDVFRSELRARVEKARALEEKMGGRSDVFRAQETPVTIERITALIPDDTALVEMLVYVPRRSADRDMPSREGPPRYAAYVLHGSGKIGFVDLGEAKAIDADVRRVRATLSNPDAAFDESAARALHDRVMAPIRPLLEEKTRILLSTDGQLSLVPFAALPDSGGRRLVDEYEITYLTSSRDLLRRANPDAPAAGALIIANPAFGRREGESALAILGEPAEEATRGLEKAYFPPLPGTAGEARAIGALFPGGAIRLDLEATESAMKAARGPMILHVATHGFFLPVKRGGAKAGSEGERGLELEEREDWLPDDPLLRAGLAFAGANSKNGGGGEDGILTALEASSLDLRGTKIVVLSACETGLGEARSGEGVYGLRRALFVAGAEALVTSFWKVADEETRALMEEYYQRLLAGEGRSAAMRDVQRIMLGKAETSHPYFWASFGVFGDPSPVVAGAATPRSRAKFTAVPPSSRGCACEAAGAGEARFGFKPALFALTALTALAALAGIRARRRERSRLDAAAKRLHAAGHGQSGARRGTARH